MQVWCVCFYVKQELLSLTVKDLCFYIYKFKLLFTGLYFLLQLFCVFSFKSPHFSVTCHLWKCWYHVYWNLAYSLGILKVIFSWKVIHLGLKKLSFRSITNENGDIWRGTQIIHHLYGQPSHIWIHLFVYKIWELRFFVTEMRKYKSKVCLVKSNFGQQLCIVSPFRCHHFHLYNNSCFT
jgi:hypothetical protein